MRIAAFDDSRIGVVAADNTVVDVTDLLQPYEPLGPEDLLPDLITHLDELRPELERRAAAGNGKPLDDVRLRSPLDRKSTRLNSSHANISYAVFCLKKKT